MTDTNQTPAAPKSKRPKIADHYLIDANGGKVEHEHEAAGIGYKLLALPNDPFELNVAQMSEKGRLMLACFGAKTLATNVTSGARNGDGADATPEEQLQAVKDRFAYIESEGQFVDRSRQGGGIVIDKDSLAMAIEQVGAAPGRSVDEIRAKIEADADYAKRARQVPEVAAAYSALVGKKVVTVDQLAF